VTATSKVMVGMKLMMMTAVVIDSVILEVESMFDVVSEWVSGGCVLVRGWGWVGPHHFHCLTPFCSAGDVWCISFLFQSPFYFISSFVNSK
jgi:hypothetical protein